MRVRRFAQWAHRLRGRSEMVVVESNLTLGRVMKSLVIKRSVMLAGHKTSVSLEDAFWESFKEIAASRRLPLSALLTEVESEHHHGNLSSGIRLFVLHHYRGQSDLARSIPLPSGPAPHRRSSSPSGAER